MNLKNIIKCLIILMLIPIFVFANSAPIYMEEYPSFNISPMKSNSIKVENEQLYFKIDESMSDHAMVTARYTLINTSEEKQRIPMLFPLVSDGHKRVEADIQLNGKAVEYQLFGVGHVNVRDYLENPDAFKQQVHINTIINQLNAPLYESKYFNDTANTSLYKITFNRPSERRTQVSFTIEDKNTRVLAIGFSGFEMHDDGRCVVSGYVHDKSIGNAGYLLVLGEGQLQDIQTSDNDTMEETNVNIKEYIQDFLKDNEYEWYDTDLREINNLYAMVLKTIDRYYETNLLAFTYDMLMDDTLSRFNVSALIYEVEFEANSRNTLEVKYPMGATIDRRNSKDFVNTFSYILNPAQNFMDFGKLEIQVILNDRDPYIIDSSIPLTEEKQGVYSAVLEGLPDEDLFFSTYSKEEITLAERTMERLLPKGYMRFFLFSGLGMLAILFIFSFGIYRIMKRNKNKYKSKK